MANRRVKALCPSTGQQVKVEYRPAKWQGEEDRVIIHQVKWVEGWK